MKVAARSVRKALVPSSLFRNPSPGNLQSTRLALHFQSQVDEYYSSCWVYIASGRQIPIDDPSVVEGKEGLLIPVQTQVMESSLPSRCPHRSEIQSIAPTETENFHIRYCLEILVVEKAAGQGFASVQVNGPWTFVETGNNARKPFHLEETQIGLGSVSVPTRTFWVDGVILVTFLWRTLSQRMRK